MELAIASNLLKSRFLNKKQDQTSELPNLTNASINVPQIIRGIETSEQGMRDFLFTLGCYEGEKVTVISILAENYIINVKDARYSIDEDLARAILV